MNRPALRAITISTLVLLTLAPSAHAAFPGKNGKIAFAEYEFISHGLANPDINTVNPDSGDPPVPLTGNDFSYNPSWSPDGKKIVFMNGPYIHTMNADGSGATQVTDTEEWGAGPTWSPDGSTLAFASTRGGSRADIYTMKVDGSDVRQITTDPRSDTEPAWSPLGDEIAFTRAIDEAGTRYDIHVARVDGTAERSLTGSLPHSSSNPSWSPDGTKIAFHSGLEVHVINADGTGYRQLTQEPPPPPDFPGYIENRQPAWSPDGTKIAFVHTVCPFYCSFQLETVNADGTGRTSLPSRTYLDEDPDWQPLASGLPDCSGVTATPSSLRHHGFQTVTLAGVTDPDGDAVTISITGVTQDEPVGRRPDARAGESADQVELRGQRRPRGDGRVYRIAFTVSDGTDECTGVATVEVRRHKKQPAVDSAPPSYDSFGN